MHDKLHRGASGLRMPEEVWKEGLIGSRCISDQTLCSV